MRTVLSRWWPTGVVLLGAFVALTSVGGVLGLAVAVLMVAYAFVLSPALFPRSADLGEARRKADAGQAPMVVWKPGCIYCVRMRLGLRGSGRRVSWVDSSIDEDAQALVRAANDGDHTTPTVFVSGRSRTNPDVDWVREQVRGH